jgi:carboxylesterase type B/CubicO group peptidase (beta-lactamase class C family)
MTRRVLVLTAALAVLGSLPHLVSAMQIGVGTARPTVTTRSGTVIGDWADSVAAISRFRGIPYAAAPTGERRWRAPGPVDHWNDPRNATSFGAACPQDDALLGQLFGARVAATSEDCLFLNVWSPARLSAGTRSGASLPVMVFIHGGGNMMGSAETYDGVALARQGVIVITINYRLGALGFLAHPALSAESPRHVSGNYALLDQIEALRWIRHNAIAFGGDSARVTVFGESAGAYDIATLLATPLARGLFARAIMESAVGLTSHPLRGSPGDTTTSAEAVGARVASTLGLDGSHATALELRALPADRLVKILPRSSPLTAEVAWPVVDSWLLDAPLLKRLGAGAGAGVPIIVGMNSDEATVLRRDVPATTVDGYRTRLAREAPDVPFDELWARYPVDTAPRIVPQFQRAMGDAMIAHAHFIAASRSRASKASTWLYDFSRVSDGPVGITIGAFHAAELPFVFGSVPLASQRVWERSADDTTLARVMSGYWVNFAKTGNPNGPAVPRWESYGTTGNYQTIGHRIGAGSDTLPRRIAPFVAALERRASGTSTRGESPSVPPVKAAELDSIVRAHFDGKGIVGLTVGVMQNGRVVFAKGYGLASVEKNTPVTTRTMFPVGSVTKQFTCSAVLLLAEDKLLAMSDKVAKYFPKLTRASDISLLDLGNHVSGYRDYYPLDYVDREMLRDVTADQIMAEYATMPLDFEPGTRWSYSNTGFTVLGAVAEKVSGVPFGSLLSKRIFTPLGMTNSSYDPPTNGAAIATGYRSWALNAPTPAQPEGKGWTGAAGAIWSTPTDLMAWDLALVSGKAISPASYKTLTTARRLKDGRSTSYGCGDGVSDSGPAIMLSHGGAVSGSVTQNTVLPASRSAVVLLANSETGLGELSNALVAKLLPQTDLPKIGGLPALDAAKAYLNQLERGTVDRSTLSEDFSAHLTPALERTAAAQLTKLGGISSVQVLGLRERGGMEVVILRLMVGKTPVTGSMYRTPDGKIQQVLITRQ